MKFYITLPALPGKHFEVDSTSRLDAVADALGLTVWTEEEWNSAAARCREMGNDIFAQSRRINVIGELYDEHSDPETDHS